VPARHIFKNAEVVRNSRNRNFNVSSHGLSDPVLSGKLALTAPGVPFKILSRPEDFHVATRGRLECRSRG
jgi:hypothetical protein